MTKGISPVIVTIIIIIITILASIAVAYWMGGLTSYFTPQPARVQTLYELFNMTDQEIVTELNYLYIEVQTTTSTWWLDYYTMKIQIYQNELLLRELRRD